MIDFDERLNSIITELATLGKECNNQEVVLEVMRALPRELNIKTMTIRESKDLSKLELHDLLVDLKDYEFELEVRSGEETSSSQPTKDLTTAVVTNSSTVSAETVPKRTIENLSNNSM